MKSRPAPGLCSRTSWLGKREREGLGVGGGGGGREVMMSVTSHIGGSDTFLVLQHTLTMEQWCW